MLTHWKNNNTPKAPFFAVIFVSTKTDNLEGYEEMDNLLMEEAQEREGYLGYSSAGDENGSVFISYWKDMDAINSWRNHPNHIVAKQKAPEQWHKYFLSIISEVKSIHEFKKELAKI